MIELKFTGMCKDCPYADIKLRAVSLGQEKWVAFCTHGRACLRVNAINQEKDDGCDYKREG